MNPLKVDVPVPGAPGAEDVTDKAGDLSAWLATQGKPFFVVLACLVGAAVLVGLLKRPFVRGLLIGAILLAIGVGCAMIYPPLGLVVPGGLVWLDLTVEGVQRRRAG